MNVIGDDAMFRNAYAFKQGLLPEAASSFHSGDCIHDTQCQDSFDRSRYDAQCKGLRIILIPRLYVESERRYRKSEKNMGHTCRDRLTAK